MKRPPHIFSIPPGTAFLPTLVRSLLNGTLVPGFPYDRSDPLALAHSIIYVPTKRAARTLRSMFVDMSSTKRAILPTIRPLGDIDNDDAFFDTDPKIPLHFESVIGRVERLLLLAQLIQSWQKNLPMHIRTLFGLEDVSILATTADALRFAHDLANLMDQLETQGASWSDLAMIAPEELSNWWQVTLQFLDIVTRLWPDILAERQYTTHAIHRHRLIALETERLRYHPPSGIVIAAGSTGSIPATAELLSVIASLPHGAVVLPGLDRDLDEATWGILAQEAIPPSIFGHPQFGLQKLMRHMGGRRSDVLHLDAMRQVKRIREHIISEALRPAETTDAWSKLHFDRNEFSVAMRGVDLIEATHEREEALAIALALRHAINIPGKTAALVTPDRDLARRVSSELARFGIEANDSGGHALRDTQAGVLFQLLLENVFNPGDPVALLALVKHPLTRIGHERARIRHAAETLELVAFRGGRGRVSIANLTTFFESKLEESTSLDYPPAWQKIISPFMLTEARMLCAILSEQIAPLMDLAKKSDQADMAILARISVAVLENLVRDEKGSLVHLYTGDAGEKFSSFLHNLMTLDSSLDFDVREWPSIVNVLISDEMVKPRASGHPRVFIWGVLEARLQTVDTIVIGGLNEGTWPDKISNDPFMSRSMKAAIAIDPPERRIGLAAHDFQMALGMDHVILSRSQRSANVPTVPSRWLQRLETVLGTDETTAMRNRGKCYLHWAYEIDAAPDIPFVKRPAPAPPVAARPKHFSVTEIEILRRDPYAIFAKKILRLRPLEPFIRDPTAMERGTLFHEILNGFTRSETDPLSPQAESILFDLAKRYFKAALLPAEIEVLWWPRFASLVPEVLKWERERSHRVIARYAEIVSGKLALDGFEITLSGRADRIDLMKDGTAEIIDYKTGSTPTKAQAHFLLSPQLALEAALLMRGAFSDMGKLEASDLLYVRLRNDGSVVPESILSLKGSKTKSEKTALQIANEAWQRLGELLADYRRPEKGYLSRSLPFRETEPISDYDHLARVLEWSTSDSAASRDEGA